MKNNKIEYEDEENLRVLSVRLDKNLFKQVRQVALIEEEVTIKQFVEYCLRLGIAKVMKK